MVSTRLGADYVAPSKKRVKRHNFILFYTISSLSLAKNGSPLFTKNFPKIPTLSPP
jgi:hypothetical protein